MTMAEIAMTPPSKILYEFFFYKINVQQAQASRYTGNSFINWNMNLGQTIYISTL
jgi:hypothetical protein